MNYLKKIFSLVIALLGLNFVIVVHEFGLFSFAKLFGVRAPVFSVGFDPAVHHASKQAGEYISESKSVEIGIGVNVVVVLDGEGAGGT